MRSAKVRYNNITFNRRAGRTFKLNGIKLKTETSDRGCKGCEGCYFDDEHVSDIIGGSCELKANYEALGPCKSENRIDKKDIIFRMLDNVNS